MEGEAQIAAIRELCYHALALRDAGLPHTAEAAMELVRRLPYDMTTYGGIMFNPAMPFMIKARAGLKFQLGLLREAENENREVLRLLESEPEFDGTWVRPVKSGALAMLAGIYRTLGEYPLAIEKSQEVLELSEQAGNFVDWQLGDLALLHAELGELRIAEDYMEKAVRSHESAVKRIGTGKGNLLGRVEKLRKLGANTKKQLPADKLFMAEVEIPLFHK